MAAFSAKVNTQNVGSLSLGGFLEHLLKSCSQIASFCFQQTVTAQDSLALHIDSDVCSRT